MGALLTAVNLPEVRVENERTIRNDDSKTIINTILAPKNLIHLTIKIRL